MAEIKKLDSIVQIDGTDYEVVAEEAKKLTNSLTIKTVKEGVVDTETVFDGSENKEITIEVAVNGGDADSAKAADTIRVNMDNGSKPYANIIISKDEPTGGNTGDIWFKYNS